MPYLIDSDWLIDRLADRSEAVELLDELAEEGIALSVISYMEVYEGAMRGADRATAERRVHALLSGIPLLPVSLDVARRCAQLREMLREQRKRVNQRALDLIIAATAIAHDLTLVTRNIADYDDLPELKLYRE